MSVSHCHICLCRVYYTQTIVLILAVVTFLFVNSHIPLETWASAYYRTGFDLISYTPPPLMRGWMTFNLWPSVEDMVRGGKRAVTFLSRGANESFVPYFLSEFDYVFEVRRPLDAAPETIREHPKLKRCADIIPKL